MHLKLLTKSGMLRFRYGVQHFRYLEMVGATALAI